MRRAVSFLPLAPLNPPSPACSRSLPFPRRQAEIILNPLKPPYTVASGEAGEGGGKERAASLRFRKGLNLINSMEHSVELSVCGLTSASLPPFMDKRERFPRDFMLSNLFTPLQPPFPLSPVRLIFLSSPPAGRVIPMDIRFEHLHDCWSDGGESRMEGKVLA